MFYPILSLLSGEGCFFEKDLKKTLSVRVNPKLKLPGKGFLRESATEESPR